MASCILSSSPLPAFDQHKNGFSFSVGFGRTSHSRSTSAGSSPSDKSNSDLQNSSSFFLGGANSFPGYDYPESWFNNPSTQLTLDVDHPPFFADGFGMETYQPHFLENSFAEQQVPLSDSIRLPPGLEDMFGPEETAARIAAATYKKQSEITELLPQAWMMNRDILQAFDADLAISAQVDLETPPPYQPPDLRLHSFTFPPRSSTSTQQTTCLQQPYAPLPTFNIQTYKEQLSFPPSNPPSQPFSLNTLPFQDEDHTLVDGSKGWWPSIGSQEHDLGTCKPCAFFHRKGCGSGNMCRFCHLCDSGAKKKRTKEKRDLLRNGALNL